MDIFGILTLIGGLALFLYGMDVMGAGLEKVSGGKLERILEKLTSNPLKGVLLGAGVTAVIQSSSATTVMVVGFVNSGIMKLSQAIGIIMGANIGTTITSWLLSLTGIDSGNVWINLLKPSSFTPVLAMIGIVLMMTGKKSKKADVGEILLGFAVLMTGMESMSGAVKPLADVPEFTNILTMFHNPIFRNSGRSTSDSGDSELVRICRYTAGTVCNRSIYLWLSYSNYFGTEYRNLCYSYDFFCWSKPECKAYCFCASVF